MMFHDEDKVLIKTYLLKGYEPMKRMTEFPEKCERHGLYISY